jgi:uncharacterized protein (DUF2164 family)
MKMAPERRRELVSAIQAHFKETHDESIGELKAGLLLDFFVKTLGARQVPTGQRSARAAQSRTRD